MDFLEKSTMNLKEGFRYQNFPEFSEHLNGRGRNLLVFRRPLV